MTAIKKELSSMDEFTSIGSQDRIFGRSASANKHGFFPASLFTQNGYACRRFDTTTSSPLWEAVGNIDYLRNLPSLLGLGCYLVADNHSRRKLDPTNHYKLATGEAALLDGSMGQYMWGWSTPWYYAWWNEGAYIYIAASLNPIPGKNNYIVPIASTSALGAGVLDRTNMKLCSLISQDAQYRGTAAALDATTYPNATGQQLSQLGMAANSIGTSTFETYGAARGSGWGAGWYWLQFAAGELFRLIYGTNDVQSAVNITQDTNGLRQGGLGAGVTTFGSWDLFNGFHPIIPTSVGVELADGCGAVAYACPKADGSTQQTLYVPVFYGYKNMFGHLYRGLNRIIMVKQADTSYKIYAAKSMLSAWSYSDTANMEYLCTTPVGTSAWSGIKTLSRNGMCGMPTEIGGTTSTYVCDSAYLTTETSGFCAPLGSGLAYDGGNAGLAYLFGYNAPSYANADLSSPLCEVDGDFSPVPTVF